jgi:hypothetical protein
VIYILLKAKLISAQQQVRQKATFTQTHAQEKKKEQWQMDVRVVQLIGI